MIYVLQCCHLLLKILLLPLFPVLIKQGKQIRKTVPKLEPPSNITSNQKEHQPYLLFIGESTLAGIGVKSHREGIAGQTVIELSSLKKSDYAWKVLAKSGYRTRVVLKKLMPQLPTEAPECIIIGMGGNDTFQLTNPIRFVSELKMIIQILKNTYPAAPIVLTGLPPVALFPAFKGLPATLLGIFVKLLAEAVKSLHQPKSEIYVMPSLLKKKDWETLPDISIEKMFSDGVHPSGATYAIWGKQVAQYINGLVL